MCYNQANQKGVFTLDYQMQKAMGKCFKAKSASVLGRIRIFGSYYEYKVIEGNVQEGDILEVIDFTSCELLVRVNKNLTESDVNYLG